MAYTHTDSGTECVFSYFIELCDSKHEGEGDREKTSEGEKYANILNVKCVHMVLHAACHTLTERDRREGI